MHKNTCNMKNACYNTQQEFTFYAQILHKKYEIYNTDE